MASAVFVAAHAPRAAAAAPPAGAVDAVSSEQGRATLEHCIASRSACAPGAGRPSRSIVRLETRSWRPSADRPERDADARVVTLGGGRPEKARDGGGKRAARSIVCVSLPPPPGGAAGADARVVVVDRHDRLLISSEPRFLAVLTNRIMVHGGGGPSGAASVRGARGQPAGRRRARARGR